MTHASQMQLFSEVARSTPHRWQWHGRQMFTELRNDFRFPRRLRRVVYRLDDACVATSEAEARAIFQAGYPDAQTLGLTCIGPVKTNKRNNLP